MPEPLERVHSRSGHTGWTLHTHTPDHTRTFIHLYMYMLAFPQTSHTFARPPSPLLKFTLPQRGMGS